LLGMLLAIIERRLHQYVAVLVYGVIVEQECSKIAGSKRWGRPGVMSTDDQYNWISPHSDTSWPTNTHKHTQPNTTRFRY